MQPGIDFDHIKHLDISKKLFDAFTEYDAVSKKASVGKRERAIVSRLAWIARGVFHRTFGDPKTKRAKDASETVLKGQKLFRRYLEQHLADASFSRCRNCFELLKAYYHYQDHPMEQELDKVLEKIKELLQRQREIGEETEKREKGQSSEDLKAKEQQIKHGTQELQKAI